MDSSDSTSLTLLDRIRANDEQAWHKLRFIYDPYVVCLCRAKGLNSHDAEEVSQEVLLAVHNRIGQFQRRRTGSFRSWLRQITSHKIADFWRKGGNQAKGGSSAKIFFEQQPQPELEDDSNEWLRSIVARAVEIMDKTGFDEKTVQAFRRTAVDGETTADVAKSLGMTPQAVRQARYKVRKRLFEEMGDMLDLPEKPPDRGEPP